MYVIFFFFFIKLNEMNSFYYLYELMNIRSRIREFLEQATNLASLDYEVCARLIQLSDSHVS